MPDPIESEILRLVSEAKHYVKASDQLRPNVLQAAKASNTRRFGLGSALMIFLTSLAASVTILWTNDQIATLPVPVGMGTDEVHEQARLRTRGTAMTFDWAVSEVVAENRQPRASNKVNFGSATNDER